MLKEKKRKIAIIAGSRGEWGYFRPVIKEIEKNVDLDYGIVVTNMHLLESFGSSIDEIKKDGFKIDAIIHNTLDGYNHVTMAKSLAIFMIQLPETLKNMKADIVLLAGDRGEQLMSAIVGAHLYLPVAHIQAGERSGNIDGVSRHAISKFAHIHFAANKDAADRLIKMGEEKSRVFNVGAPQLDELIHGDVASANELVKLFNLNEKKQTILVVQHPVTEEFEKAEHAMRETLLAVKRFNANIIIVQNNSDAGAYMVQRAISKYRTSDMKIIPNMPRKHYVGLLKLSDVLVGNSSSALLEAPTFDLPAVNIGRRQDGRVCADNVISCRDYDSEKIYALIKYALTKEFKQIAKNSINPYGDGHSSKRIVDILRGINIDEKLLIKQITY